MNATDMLAALTPEDQERWRGYATSAVWVTPMHATRGFYRAQLEPGQFCFFLADEDATLDELALALLEMTLTVNCNVKAAQIGTDLLAQLQQQLPQ